MMQAPADCCSHVFMSLEDFASVVSRNKGAALQMMERFPDVALSLLRSTPAYAHVVRWIDVGRQYAFSLYAESHNLQMIMNLTTHNISDDGQNVSSREKDAAEMLRAAEKFLRRHKKQVALFHAYAGIPAYHAVSSPLDQHRDEKTQASHPSVPSPPWSSRRRLLQSAASSQQSRAIDRYSGLVAASDGFSNVAISSAYSSSSVGAPLVTETWLEGPFGWPPKLSGIYSTGDRCLAGEHVLETAGQVFRVVKAYYETDFSAKVRQPPWDLSSNVPRLLRRTNDDQQQKQQQENAAGGHASASNMYEIVLGAMQSYAPWMGDSVSSFFTVRRGGGVSADALTLGNLAHDALVCDFDNVMFCGREGDEGRIRRNILLCGLVALVAWMFVAGVVSAVPLVGGGASTLLYAAMLWLVPATALHLAYGMAPTCFPLVPTCAMQDLLETLRGVMPMHVSWPDSLQQFPGCIESELSRPSGGSSSSSRQAQLACMRSCSRDERFLFAGWEDSVAWLACSYDAAWCTSLDLNALPIPSFLFGAASREAVHRSAVRYSAVLLSGDADLVSGHSYCFVVTLGQILPGVFLLVGSFYLALALLRLPFAVASAVAQLAAQALAYTHVE